MNRAVSEREHMETAGLDNFLENFGCEEEERGLLLQKAWSGRKIFLRWGRPELFLSVLGRLRGKGWP